jgi:hypothetical protein
MSRGALDAQSRTCQKVRDRKEKQMFPIYATPEFVRAEQSYRLEGFHRWSRRRGETSGSAGVDDTPPRRRATTKWSSVPPSVAETG